MRALLIAAVGVMIGCSGPPLRCPDVAPRPPPAVAAAAPAPIAPRPAPDPTIALDPQELRARTLAAWDAGDLDRAWLAADALVRATPASTNMAIARAIDVAVKNHQRRASEALSVIAPVITAPVPDAPSLPSPPGGVRQVVTISPAGQRDADPAPAPELDLLSPKSERRPAETATTCRGVDLENVFAGEPTIYYYDSLVRSGGRIVAYLGTQATKTSPSRVIDVSSVIGNRDRPAVSLQGIAWAVLDGGSLFVRDHVAAWIAAFDPATGSLLWRTSDAMCNSRNFAVRGRFVACGYRDRQRQRLRVLDRDTGAAIGERTLPTTTEIGDVFFEGDRLAIRIQETNFYFEVRS